MTMGLEGMMEGETTGIASGQFMDGCMGRGGKKEQGIKMG